jgi:protein phosphatase
MLTMTSYAVTDRGRVRESNEDAVLVTDRLVAVADGMGGHAAGEVASSMAVDRMRALDGAVLRPDDVVDAVVDADRLIRARGAGNAGFAGMGTTLCGVALVDTDDGPRCAVFNVGDSRVYRYSDGRLTQVSVDHSEVQELRDAGKLSAAAAALYPRRNVITRCLGSVGAVTPDVWSIEPVDGERFLLCSDGLTGEVDDTVIAELLAAHATPETAATALLERALAAGGHDNVAVVVADVRCR